MLYLKISKKLADIIGIDKIEQIKPGSISSKIKWDGDSFIKPPSYYGDI
jgi:hypothetical protein